MIKEKEILALQKRLDADYQADKEAIKRVLKLLKKKGIRAGIKNRGCPKAGESLPNGNGDSAGSEKRIAAAIQSTTGQFTLSDIVKVLPNENRSTISGVLFRSKDKSVKIVTPGRGRKPAVYEKM
jgi:hypothetical protein